MKQHSTYHKTKQLLHQKSACCQLCWRRDNIPGGRGLVARRASAQRRPGPFITGGRFGGAAGVAAELLSQADQFAGKGGELLAELINLIPLRQDQSLDVGWRRQPVRL